MRRSSRLLTRRRSGLSLLTQRLSLIALGLSLWLSPAYANSALERLKLADSEVLLNGVGVAKQLNEELYVATLYATRPSREPLELLDARQRRRVQLRVIADRMYPSGVARHFRDLISLNNPRDEITREAKNLNRFYSLFQQGLMRGDELILDNIPNRGLVININGQNVAEFGSPLLFDLLLRCFIGDKPPNLQFRSQLLGDQDSASRAAILARFAALAPQEERLQSYATVKLPAAEPVAETPPERKPEPVANKKPEPAVVISKPAKPEPVTTTTAATTTAATATTTPAVSTPPPIAANPPSSTSTVASNKPATRVSETAAIAPGSNTDSVQAPSKRQLSEADVSALLQRYEAQLRERLTAGLEYPRREMKRKYGITQMARQKGKVVLRLHLDIGGDINAAWLQERTNEAILDNAALALVDKLAPFPPMPKELPESAYEFYVPLEFDPDR
jgi:TonB family protein